MTDSLATNRRGQNDYRLANLVFEAKSRVRHEWWIYQFKAQAALKDYPLGPGRRVHGLAVDDFVAHRRYMRTGVTHIFIVIKRPLVPETVVELFAEALDLPAPR